MPPPSEQELEEFFYAVLRGFAKSINPNIGHSEEPFTEQLFRNTAKEHIRNMQSSSENSQICFHQLLDFFRIPEQERPFIIKQYQSYFSGSVRDSGFVR